MYLPRKDERLSRPGWLTYSGWFTYISDHRQLQVERRTGKVRWSKTNDLYHCTMQTQCIPVAWLCFLADTGTSGQRVEVHPGAYRALIQ